MVLNSHIANLKSSPFLRELQRDMDHADSHTANMAKKPKKLFPPNHLRDWREHCHLTQEQPSNLARVPESTISSVERRERGLTDTLAFKLAPPLGANPGWLTDYHPNDPELALIRAWRNRA